MQNAFFASLQNNDVKYYISGHDHIHQRSIITSPDGASKVQELICASNSSKFYTPEALTDPKNPNWYAQKRRETSLSQEMYHIGYYIFTVDGPQVTVDYYSDDHGNWKSDSSYPKGPTGAGSQITPTFKFVKKETWGYSLNGHEFLVIQGQMYTSVVDSFGTTTARILSGINGSTARDFNNRPLTKTVNTGWSPPKADNLASNVLTLWGMADLGSNQTDVYTLSMTYDHKIGPFGNGDFGLATKDKDGKWINAVDMNILGAKKFVLGPWDLSYGIGTYGVDPTTNTAWAVIHYNGDFAVARDIEPVPEH